MTDEDNTVEMDPRDIEPGTLIGYEPVGSEDVEGDVRAIGFVKKHRDNDLGVVVSMKDDPGIEERVPYDRIKSVETDE